MANYIKEQSIVHKDIYLLFGCRTKEDLLYFDELKALSDGMPNFHYIPTLSRENWEGAHGYVHDIYEKICAANGNAPASFFLCGWKAMIDEAKQRIQALGYDRKSIHQELYG